MKPALTPFSTKKTTSPANIPCRSGGGVRFLVGFGAIESAFATRCFRSSSTRFAR
jgi:hypothetical protein